MMDIIREDLAHTARTNEALDSHISFHNAKKDVEASLQFAALPSVVVKEKNGRSKEDSKQVNQCTSKLEEIKIVGIPLSSTRFPSHHSGCSRDDSVTDVQRDSDVDLNTVIEKGGTNSIDDIKATFKRTTTASQHSSYCDRPPWKTLNADQDKVSVYNLTLEMKKRYDLLKPQKASFWDQYQAKLKFEMQRSRMRHADIFYSKTTMRYLAAKRNKMNRMQPTKFEPGDELPKVIGQKISLNYST